MSDSDSRLSVVTVSNSVSGGYSLNRGITVKVVVPPGTAWYRVLPGQGECAGTGVGPGLRDFVPGPTGVPAPQRSDF